MTTITLSRFCTYSWTKGALLRSINRNISSHRISTSSWNRFFIVIFVEILIEIRCISFLLLNFINDFNLLFCGFLCHLKLGGGPRCCAGHIWGNNVLLFRRCFCLYLFSSVSKLSIRFRWTEDFIAKFFDLLWARFLLLWLFLFPWANLFYRYSTNIDNYLTTINRC